MAHIGSVSASGRMQSFVIGSYRPTAAVRGTGLFHGDSASPRVPGLEATLSVVYQPTHIFGRWRAKLTAVLSAEL